MAPLSPPAAHLEAPLPAATRWTVRLLRRPGMLHLLALLAALLLTLLTVLAIGPRLALWDEQSASLIWSLADPQRVERRVVIVDIDERSTQAIGPWPWPRARQAELLEKLDAAGVSLKMLDILFEGSQRDDRVLARALASPVPTVPAQLFSLDPGITVQSGQLGGALPLGSTCPQASETAYGYMASSSALALALRTPAAAVGHITPLVDPDGAIRQLPALICHQGHTYATLAVSGLLAATEATPALRHDDALLAPPWWLELGALRLPLDSHGHLRVSYQMPRQGFLSVSAVDVLEGRLPADLLKGTWALVGATAFGSRDVVPTPLGRAVSGVEVHAQALSALLDGRTPYAPQGAWLWPWLAGGLAGLLLLAARRLAPRAPHLVLPLASVLLLVGLYASSAVLLLEAQLWLGWLTPALFVVLSALLLGTSEYARSRFERELLYRNLSSYLPEPVAREVATREPDAHVHGRRQTATVLHADLRNFSAYCEGRPPEETAMVLHLFFTTASRIVEERGGVVEQMVGDSLLAVWNGSLPCEQHAQRALEAARVLWLTCVPQLPVIDAPDVPPLDLGIGIETGSIMIGSFGPAGRRVHTVLGEAVTVATRLQAMTGELAYPILTGANLAAASRNGEPLLRLGEFLLNGLSRPRSVYALPVDRPQLGLRLVHDVAEEQGGSSGRHVA
ncbi:MAG: adenylate/guanylate cyclase domain-containing protein [Sterolibacterium sp.]|nr:adenylate/guanylate cyclase domain-containing protein [Sterolibacterium sp.]MBP9799476.1 adenylate/guanylate cyclase domain-containing protein [Sterolibacterium sp.]